jgi:hypothetical protein
VHVHRTVDRVVAEYVGEPRPRAFSRASSLPPGGIVTHFDRFILPSIAQVEYSIGTENHLLVDSVMTPVDDFRTRVYAVVSFRTRIPHFLIRPFVKPLALRVFKQDAFIVAKHTETIHRFAASRVASPRAAARCVWSRKSERARPYFFPYIRPSTSLSFQEGRCAAFATASPPSSSTRATCAIPS